MKRRLIVGVISVLAVVAALVWHPVQAETSVCQTATDALCYEPQATELVQHLNAVVEPKIAVPVWLTSAQ